LVSDAVALEALTRIRHLWEKAPTGSDKLNPIGLLEAIAGRSGIALVPLVFGYVNYAAAQPGRHAVAFSEAPRIATGGRRGSVLGGTGIGITRRVKPDAAMLDRLRWLMSEEAQIGFIPAHDGQPSARAAWRNDDVNRAWGGFYRSTIATTADAWVRPRFNGYIAFQTAASAILRQALESAAEPAAAMAAIRTQWRAFAPSDLLSA
jgi:multiple sugar transport system substrate-binding protein